MNTSQSGKTITATDATIRLAEMVEPRPSKPATLGDAKKVLNNWSASEVWAYRGSLLQGQWRPRLDPLHSLNDAVRVAEAIKALWLRSVVSGGDRWFVVTAESEGESIYTDNRHAWHLCEAILSAVDGEQTTIMED